MITASVLNTLSSTVPVLRSAVVQGILWGIMILGVYIMFRLLDIADLTVDGSFALDDCVCAILVVRYNVNPALALLMVMIIGLLAGAITGALHTVFEIPAILVGVLIQVTLWSISLWVTGSKSNMPLLKVKALIFSMVGTIGLTQSRASLIVGIAVAILMIVLLH